MRGDEARSEGMEQKEGLPGERGGGGASGDMETEERNKR